MTYLDRYEYYHQVMQTKFFNHSLYMNQPDFHLFFNSFVNTRSFKRQRHYLFEVLLEQKKKGSYDSCFISGGNGDLKRGDQSHDWGKIS